MSPTTTPATPRHPIAVVVDRTGLSQHVLRVWERRYGAVEPTRGQGGHRLYSDDDVARFRLLHAATRAGRGIGQVARLPSDALSRLVAEDAAARVTAPPAATPAPSPGAAAAPDATRERDPARDPARAVLAQALALTLALDAPALDDLLRRAAARLGVPAFIEHVVTPLLGQMGEAWRAGRATMAQERLAASTVHDLLIETMRALARGTGAARMVLATPPGDPGERHAMEAAVVGAGAAADGWGVVYLGPTLPAGEIAAVVAATAARAVAVSVGAIDDRARVLGELRALRARLPAAIPVLVGGDGAPALAAELAGPGIRVGARWADLRVALGDASAPDAP